jgi:nitrogenase molybdenum-iron protein alpha/beta subunit
MGQQFSTPMNYPTLLGVYLAVNALKDAYVLVDGPDCAFYKAHFIHGRHDLNSTLLRISGRHRVAFTNVCSRGVVKEHDDIIGKELQRMDALSESGLVLVTALPMCSITGVDYGRVIRLRSKLLSKPAIDIPPESLVGDWLDGYDQTLNALAKGIELDPSRRRPGTVAIVGNLMDRNESDHLANIAEMKRMLKSLSLETVSVWLSGQDSSDLRRVEEADLIVSLPYGRAAARRLAHRTGATLVETELPFGLPKTVRFMRDVGAAAGKDRDAEAFIDEELSRVVPRLKWIIPQYFLNKRTGFMGDPYLLGGFRDIADDLGLKIEGSIVRGRSAHGAALAGADVLYEPPSMSDEVRKFMEIPLDLFVSCWCEHEWPVLKSPTMEFGFPSYRHHALSDRPFLGFNGFLAFVERMADELSRPKRKIYG